MSSYSIAASLVVLAIPLSVCAQSPQATTMAVPAPQSAQYAAPPPQAAPPAQAAPPVQVQYVVQAGPEADRARSRQIVWGPGPIGLTLAAVGRRLSTLDRRHVWTVQRTAYVRTHQTVVYQEAPKPPPVTYVAVPPAKCAPPQVFQYQTVLPQTYALTSEQAPPPPTLLQSPTPTAQH